MAPIFRDFPYEAGAGRVAKIGTRVSVRGGYHEWHSHFRMILRAHIAVCNLGGRCVGSGAVGRFGELPEEVDQTIAVAGEVAAKGQQLIASLG